MYFRFLSFKGQDVPAPKILVEDSSEKCFTDNGFCFPRNSCERSNYAPGRCKCSFTDMQPCFYSFSATIESFPTTQLLEATIRVKLWLTVPRTSPDVSWRLGYPVTYGRFRTVKPIFMVHTLDAARKSPILLLTWYHLTFHWSSSRLLWISSIL